MKRPPSKIILKMNGIEEKRGIDKGDHKKVDKSCN